MIGCQQSRFRPQPRHPDPLGTPIVHFASAPAVRHVHFLMANSATAQLQLADDAQVKLKPNAAEQVYRRPMPGQAAAPVQVKPRVAELLQSLVDDVHRSETGRSNEIAGLPPARPEHLLLVGPY
jgi:hypothetical protein